MREKHERGVENVRKRRKRKLEIGKVNNKKIKIKLSGCILSTREKQTKVRKGK